MQFNPLENEDTNLHRESKNKSISNVPLPVTLKQLEQLLGQREAAVAAGKIALIGRIVGLTEMAGRTLVTLTDETGSVNVIEVQNADQMEEGQYYHLIVFVKLDK